jgi:hypothetical protein
MDSLPEDILAPIFQLISDAESFHNRYLEDVIRVCRRWHAIALSHRRLWARIIIDIEADNPIGVYDARSCYISRRMSVSGTAPLAIEISLVGLFHAHCSNAIFGGYDLSYKDKLLKYFDQARRLVSLAVGDAGEHMVRWGSLSIDLSTHLIDFEEDDARNEYLLKDLRYPTPMLKVLSLNRVSLNWVNGPSDLLPSLPSLTHCKLAVSGSIHRLNVPWSSLRSLELSEYSESTDPGLLLNIPNCTHLEGLHFTNPARWQPETLEELKNINPFKCTLPSLSCFELLCPIPLDMTSFNLPSLIHLTLAIPDSFMDPHETAPEPKMQRVQHISTLAVHTRRLKLLHTFPSTLIHNEHQAPKVKLVEMLECMPKLEEIHLPSTLYWCMRNILREDVDIVPHLERILVVPMQSSPILVNRKDLMPEDGSTNWRVSTLFFLPTTF